MYNNYSTHMKLHHAPRMYSTFISLITYFTGARPTQISTSAHSTPSSSPGSSPLKRRAVDEAKRRSPSPFVPEDHRGKKPADPGGQGIGSGQAMLIPSAALEGSLRPEKALTTDSLSGTPPSLSDKSPSPEKSLDDLPSSHKSPLSLRDSQEEGSSVSSFELSLREEQTVPVPEQHMEPTEGE